MKSFQGKTRLSKSEEKEKIWLMGKVSEQGQNTEMEKTRNFAS